ncbi:MAG: tRNA (adenosine(37)-N6)-threonylcarbamoyltransferase complex transferase subunit TsaD [Patescibacteria group bacterium]
MKILSIETSCDDTAIAIADFRRGKNGVSVRVPSHIISSQATIHAAFGGVVPNLARREHQKNLVPILCDVLSASGGKKKTRTKNGGDIDHILEREQELLVFFRKHVLSLPPPDIDALAVTYGPGLAPALWTGVNFARALATLWQKPLIPVNHMAGHFFSALLKKRGKENTTYHIPDTKYPILALLVSGGHTELVLVKKPWRFTVIGETRDDAVGEAFDKVGRVLGLPYPGGPAISRLAQKGDPKKYPLPSPMLASKDYDFSFSGLKTAAFYLIRDLPPYETRSHRADIAASFEKAALDVLVSKTVRAAQEHKARTVLIGGGVSANTVLRQRLGGTLGNTLPSARFMIPDLSLAGDNALMIATAAYMTGMKKVPTTDVGTDANARLD